MEPGTGAAARWLHTPPDVSGEPLVIITEALLPIFAWIDARRHAPPQISRLVPVASAPVPDTYRDASRTAVLRTLIEARTACRLPAVAPCTPGTRPVRAQQISLRRRERQREHADPVARDAIRFSPGHLCHTQ